MGGQESAAGAAGAVGTTIRPGQMSYGEAGGPYPESPLPQRQTSGQGLFSGLETQSLTPLSHHPWEAHRQQTSHPVTTTPSHGPFQSAGQDFHNWMKTSVPK